ncbi:phosphatidylglycerophosphatase A family protein [Spirosoma rigui]|uniref:phosphatidylglycerophosphatase A family protein n=1 Tax=Spirosoma rigui TaxID=564064 RepID=UPI0012D2D4B0|nr:phosphatidylglycerophosphatase A [Spirosoma rigui]
MKHIHKFFASGLGLGYIPVGAGTVASVVTIVVVYLLETAAVAPGQPPSAGLWLLIIGLVTFGGVWSASVVEADWGEDSNRVVIDEVAGMLIAIWALPHTPVWLLAGLVLFRFLDIRKPGPIRRLEQLPGGWGVMFDDVGAGVVANGVLQGVWFFTKG